MKYVPLAAVAGCQLLLVALSGCDDSSVQAHNQQINRCYHRTVASGRSLEERKNVFERRDQLKSGCSGYYSTLDGLPFESVATYGFGPGFYPQGESDRKEANLYRESYEKSFTKNYADYQVTLASTIPNKCLGSSFYECVNRLSQNFTVTTDTTGSYIDKPGCIAGICNSFSSAQVTIRPPMSHDKLIDNQTEIGLFSSSAAKTTRKIMLTFNPHQAASLVGVQSKEDLYNSGLYEVFGGLNAQCEAQDREAFYATLYRLFSGPQPSKNHLYADGFSATAANSWSSNKSVKLCGMNVRAGGFVGVSVDWSSSIRTGRMYLEIRP